MPTVGRLRSPRLTSPPASPVQGEMYFDTGANKLYWWSGTAWIDASGGSAPPEVFLGPGPTPPSGSQVLWIDTAAAAPVVPPVLGDNNPLLMPPGVFSQNVLRAHATSAISVSSGQLRLMGLLAPAGKQITKVWVSPSQSPGAVTNQWACIVRPSDLAVLSKGTDLGSTAFPATGQPLILPGLDYTPATDEMIYIGVVLVGGSPWVVGVSYSGSSTSPGPAADLPPMLVGNSTAGLTNPASLGANAAALSYYNQNYWVGIGS